MSCDLKRPDVSTLVLRVVSDDNSNYPTVTEDTPFGAGGLDIDAYRVRTYFVPIKGGVEAVGCGIPSLSPGDFTTTSGPNAVNTVGDLVTLVFKALKPIAVELVDESAKRKRLKLPTEPTQAPAAGRTKSKPKGSTTAPKPKPKAVGAKTRKRKGK